MTTQVMTFSQGVARLKELAPGEDATAFEMGDIALALCPIGTDHTNNGSGDVLEQLAEAAGVDVVTLRNRRFVASRIPDALRRASVRWSAYFEIASVGDPDQRQHLLTMVLTETPSTPSGRWTVNAIRQLRGKASMGRTFDPAVQRVQAAPLEEKAAVFVALREDEAVRQVVAQRDQEREAQSVARRAASDARVKAITESDPVSTVLDNAKALSDLTSLVASLPNDGPALLERIKLGTERDILHSGPALRDAVNRARAFLDSVEVLLTTGRVSGDVDDFLKGLREKGGAGS